MPVWKRAMVFQPISVKALGGKQRKINYKTTGMSFRHCFRPEHVFLSAGESMGGVG